jgi:iron(II)-dependent oxidoreductase
MRDLRRPSGRTALAILTTLVVAGCSSAAPAASTPPSSAPSAVVTASPAPTTAPSVEASATPSAPAVEASPGQTRTDAAGVQQVYVPAGTFRMGTDQAEVDKLLAAGPPDWVAVALPSEVPAHDVTLSKGYWIDTTEVTNAMFEAFKDAGGYTTQSYWSPEGWDWLSHRVVAGLPKPCEGDAPDVPRRCITWYEAEAYAKWRGGRLPTEAEWEYAARGPKATVYPWGDEWDPAKANVVDSTAPAAVGTHPTGASWVGAQDMSGNAMEWVSDWLAPHQAGPVTDPTGPAEGTIKVEKGGWWGSNPFVARSAYRHYEDPPPYNDEHIGFRVVSAS